MCGVVGAVGLHVTHEAAAGALASLAHRGPDGAGDARFDVAGCAVWLGHRRLSILDRSAAGAQPMRSRDGRWTLTYNGEIYNHLELRKRLSGPWAGHSDTETLVEAIAAWGIEHTLTQLNGLFAFAALDHQGAELHLVRDPFGIKPLYHAQAGDGGLVFASETRAFAHLAPLPQRVDEQALQTWLALRYVPSPHTLLAGVQRVRPGHRLSWSLRDGSVTEHCYIAPRGPVFEGSLDEAAEAYRAKLGTAVQRQLLSDVPVGVLLSGGIDSALIAACTRSLGHTLPAYTVGYGGGQAECELEPARETARLLGLPHHAISIDHEQLWDALRPTVAVIEEPLGTTSVLPMWHLTQRARQDVAVVLAGQGSDEPWGGYRRYQIEVLRETIPGLSALGLFGNLLTGHWFKDSGLPDHIARGLHSLSISDLPERFLAAYELFSPEQRALLTGHANSGHALPAIRHWLHLVGGAANESAMKMMHIDARMNLADDLLLYGDKISMAFSQEVRVPMLDVELMAFVESLPLKYRVRSRVAKIALRQAAQQMLPRQLIDRPKQGFGMPFSQWVRTLWRERVEALLLSPGAPHLRYLSRQEIARCLQLHITHGWDLGRQLFALLTFAVWCEHHAL